MHLAARRRSTRHGPRPFQVKPSWRAPGAPVEPRSEPGGAAYPPGFISRPMAFFGAWRTVFTAGRVFESRAGIDAASAGRQNDPTSAAPAIPGLDTGKAGQAPPRAFLASGGANGARPWSRPPGPDARLRGNDSTIRAGRLHGVGNRHAATPSGAGPAVWRSSHASMSASRYRGERLPT